MELPAGGSDCWSANDHMAAFAEQFYNEKLITDVLRIGVTVGAQQWSKRTIEYKVSVNRNDIVKAVSQVMVGEEANEMRGRARALGDAAKKAVEEDGSSYIDLNSLLEDLRMKRSCSKAITI